MQGYLPKAIDILVQAEKLQQAYSSPSPLRPAPSQASPLLAEQAVQAPAMSLSTGEPAAAAAAATAAVPLETELSSNTQPSQLPLQQSPK